jgi:exoribonuclease R
MIFWKPFSASSLGIGPKMRPAFGSIFPFSRITTGLGKFGVFVAESESKSEGMVRLMDLGSDFFAYDEKNQVIKGRNSNTEYRVGQMVKIKVKETNLERRTIDYVLVL